MENPTPALNLLQMDSHVISLPPPTKKLIKLLSFVPPRTKVDHHTQDSHVFIIPTLHCSLPVSTLSSPAPDVAPFHVESHMTDISLLNLSPIVQRKLNKLCLLPRSRLSPSSSSWSLCSYSGTLSALSLPQSWETLRGWLLPEGHIRSAVDIS